MAADTPNIGLKRPDFQSPLWHIPMNYNSDVLDGQISSMQTAVDLNTAHATSNGGNHSWLGQDVSPTAIVEFLRLVIDNGGIVTITPNSNGDDLVIRGAGNTNAGISILCDDGSTSQIRLGDNSVDTNCIFFVSSTTEILHIGTRMANGVIQIGTGLNGVAGITVQANQQVSFKNYDFPINDGTAGQSLKTDGAGGCYWG